jgi:hypothetical protein
MTRAELLAHHNNAPVPPARTPQKQRALPGMEDRANRELEEIALAYAEVRDRRVALLAEEVTLKQRAFATLKRLGRQTYHRDGIDMAIIPGEDTLKVKVSPPPSADTNESADATEEGA